MSEGAPQGGPATGKDLAQIAAAVTAVVGVLAGLAVSGVLERTQRDHGVWLLAAFACVLAAATLWLLAEIRPGRLERPLQIFAAVAFAVGLALAIWAVLKTQQEAERPAVSATFNPTTSVLKALVTADGLTPSQRIVIRVDGLVYPAKPGKIDATNLYFGVLGANPDGKVNEPVHLIVPPGEFDAVGVKAWTGSKDQECSYANEVDAVRSAAGQTKSQKNEPGCIIVTVPEPPASPQLSALWANGRLLILHVAAKNNLGPVSMEAVGLYRKGKGRTQLATWVGTPGPDGVLNVSLRVPVNTNVRRICAEARFPGAGRTISNPPCPLRGQGRNATRIELAARTEAQPRR